MADSRARERTTLDPLSEAEAEAEAKVEAEAKAEAQRRGRDRALRRRRLTAEAALAAAAVLFAGLRRCREKGPEGGERTSSAPSSRFLVRATSTGSSNVSPSFVSVSASAS
jgi:uncharacterized protein (DUF2267 family)